jgi:HNH endonuclease
MELTLARLREVLHYDPGTGVFTWKVARPPHCVIGSRAGTITKLGYRAVTVLGHRLLEHRLAWFYQTGTWPKDQIDHRNCNGQDNRFANLREARQYDNIANRPAHRDSSTGLKGVHRNGRRWSASILNCGKKHYLGTFDTPEEAHSAYAAVATKLCGEFARVA